MDRYHHQYVKTTYDEVDFLRDNGITFYSLQSLFWNQLLLPGEQRVGEAQLSRFTPEIGSADNVPVRLHDGKLDYEWTVSKDKAQILSSLITYKSIAHGTSTLRWNYGDFKAFGSKQFPYSHDVTAQTEATGKQMTLRVMLTLSDVKADANWEERTSLSGNISKCLWRRCLANSSSSK